jgi:hypothetical protein
MKLNELATTPIDAYTEADQEWDRILQADIKAGKLDAAIEQAKSEYDAGETAPL